MMVGLTFLIATLTQHFQTPIYTLARIAITLLNLTLTMGTASALLKERKRRVMIGKSCLRHPNQ
jgi:tRNA U34 5-methylaminomethyl-2-thiouridine-forming methyltransferase MnmC